MKRQKVNTDSSPCYPTRTGFQPRRKGLLCAGLMLVTVGAVGCPGDIAVPIDGDMVVPSETFFVALPAEGVRTLHYDGGQTYVDFHLELVVDNWDLSNFLKVNAPELLDRIEVALQSEAPQAFNNGNAIRELEGRVRQLLADQWTGGADSPVYNFIECTLIVDDLGREEIDGDMPA